MIDHNTFPDIVALRFDLAVPILWTAVFVLYPIHQKIDGVILLHLDF